MHHGILLKVNGFDLEDANVQASEIMAKTLACKECYASKQEVNWDYFSCVGEVDEAWISKYRSDLEGVKTVEDLVKHYVELRNEKLKWLVKKTGEELIDFNEKFTEYAKKVEDGEEVEHTFTMLDFYINKLRALQNVIEFGNADEGLYVLHCTDNHYADMTEYTEGEKVFYFWYDRHY